MSRSASARTGRGKASAKSSSKPLVSSGYLNKSQLPFHSLIFLLPLMVLYELGNRLLGEGIYAQSMMTWFFHQFGATGRSMPALAVVSILLVWHIARRDEWKIDPGVIGGMVLESVVLAIPLVGIGLVLARHLTLLGLAELGKLTLLSMGAGIYEELVFRLAAFTILTLILIDGLKMERRKACLLMVVISAIVFSHYHYWGGTEAFQWRSFIFRTVAGVYFGVVFLIRGFGITSGCHVAYDIFVFTLQYLR